VAKARSARPTDQPAHAKFWYEFSDIGWNRAGLHFRFSCQAGQARGRQVGAWVVATALRPLPLMARSR
jgi:hypothetical protein